MNLIGESSLDKILDAAWRGFQGAAMAVEALESIGLSPDGSAVDKNGKPGMSSLFAAQTACEDAILEIFGIRRDTPGADMAAEALAKLAQLHDGLGAASAAGTGAVRMAMAKLSDGVPDKDQASRDKPYEVTVTMTGGMTVYAESEAAAMATVNAMPTDEIMRAACWDCPAATDAYEG